MIRPASLLLAATLLLTGCGESETGRESSPPANKDPQRDWVKVTDRISKICDGRRLIYVKYNTDDADQMTVVEDARECK
jgi:uncharacterized lipoprotein YajG